MSSALGGRLRKLCALYLEKEYEYRERNQPDGITGCDPRRLELCEHECAASDLILSLERAGINVSESLEEKIHQEMERLCPDCP